MRPATTRTARRRRAGFTLIEIMVAMVIMIFGVMSIVQLQAQTVRNTVHAREMHTALQIAQNAIERLKLDGRTWIQVGRNNPLFMTSTLGDANVLGDTIWLQYIIANNFTWMTFEFPENTAGVPAGTNLTASPATDFFGRDLPGDAPSLLNRHYCTGMRLTWTTYGMAMRSDVRVYWRKDKSVTGDPNELPGGCRDPGAGQLEPGGAYVQNYHFVYLSTEIRMVDDDLVQP